MGVDLIASNLIKKALKPNKNKAFERFYQQKGTFFNKKAHFSLKTLA
jgi:hypothetical protein